MSSLKVLVVTNMHPNPWTGFSDIHVKEHAKLMYELFGIESIIISGGVSSNTFLSRIKKHVLFILRIIISSIFDDFGLIHAHYIFPTAFFALLAKYYKRRSLIVTVHGSDINQTPYYNKIFYNLTCFTLRRADFIITVSEDLKNKMISLFKIPSDKIKVINMGVNNGLFYAIPKEESRNKLNLDYKTKIILFVGSLSKVKGIEFLIKAVRLIIEKYKDEFSLKCIIIGDGPLRKTYEELSTEMGISEHIDFLGFKSHLEIPIWMSAADILVSPSLQEGFGLVAAEALSCGTPVIASNVGGLSYIVKDGKNGFTVEPGDYEAIACKIALLLSNNDLYREISYNCIKSASHFNIESKVIQIATIYQKLSVADKYENLDRSI